MLIYRWTYVEDIKDSLSLGIWNMVSKYMHVTLMKRVMIVISKWPTDVFIWHLPISIEQIIHLILHTWYWALWATADLVIWLFIWRCSVIPSKWMLLISEIWWAFWKAERWLILLSQIVWYEKCNCLETLPPL